MARKRGGWSGLAVVVAVAMGAGAAHAQGQHVTWPTLMRAGPGDQYVELDEIARADNFDVLACTNGWCQVRTDGAVGYIRAETIARPAPPPAANPQPCFDARRSGYEAGQIFSYCPK